MTARIDNLCNEHQSHPEMGHRCGTCHRIRTELKILRRTVDALLKAGYFVSVNDGEETTLIDCREPLEIMNSAWTTDEDYLYVRKQGTGVDREYDAFVRFIYGNNGADVISDYSTSLESVLRPVLNYAEKLEVYA